MTQRLQIHSANPQLRLINQVVTVLREGSVIAYPTDSAYALGCQLGSKEAMDRIKQLRALTKDHHFTLMCRDLSDLGSYARVSNVIFRSLKAHTPGAYTFILPASREIPRRLQHPKRKTIGLRVPANPIVSAILEALGEPMLSVTLILPGDEVPLSDPHLIYDKLQGRLDMLIDGGFCGSQPTTVIDWVEELPQIVRVGKGDPTPFIMG